MTGPPNENPAVGAAGPGRFQEDAGEASEFNHTTPTPSGHAFRAAIRAAGLEPPEHIEPGRFYRFPGADKRNSNTAGWCLLFEDREGGVYGDWSTDFREVWQAKRNGELSREERDVFRRQVAKARKQAERERSAARAETAQRARELWGVAAPPPDDHPYLVSRGVRAHGVRIYRGDMAIAGMACDSALMVPMCDASGEITSIEFIDAVGAKRFLPGPRPSGGYHAIGRPAEIICIAEGYATAASIHEASVHAVAVAFSAGNLDPVAKALKEKFPDTEIIIAGDNDDSGVGQAKAEAAAQAVGGLVAIPPEAGTDWNDVHRDRGAEAVRAGIEAATSPINIETQSAEPEPANDDTEIARLAALSPFRYDRERKTAAKRLGVQIGTLDDEVRRRRRATEENKERHAIESLFIEIPEYDGDVAGADLLQAIKDELARYIVFPSVHEPTAVALWVLHTWTTDAAYVSPILGIQSPQKRCGKSHLMMVLRAMVCRGLATENISVAALYRAMDQYCPTLLIDEFDAFGDDAEELRGIVNAGHSRGSRTLRIGGSNRDQLEAFDAFGPKAIAGIGKRRDTIADRSITISLRRRMKGEAVELLRLDRLDYTDLQSHCAAWSEKQMDALRSADAIVPESLHDRAADNWRPLLAIADLCGAGTEARKAAMALSEDADEEAAGVMVLADIRRLFAERETDRLTSAAIVEALAEMEDRPWPEWRKGKPMTQRQLARLLADFRITPASIKVELRVMRGYRLEQFRDAFCRYLPDPAILSATPLQGSTGAVLGDSESATAPDSVADRSATATPQVADENRLKASDNADGSGVADRKTDMGGRRVEL